MVICATTFFIFALITTGHCRARLHDLRQLYVRQTLSFKIAFSSSPCSSPLLRTYGSARDTGYNSDWRPIAEYQGDVIVG